MSELEQAVIDAPEPEVNDNPAPEPEKQEFKPWKERKAAEDNRIPYSRFQEVNEERKTYQTKAQELQERLAKYEAREKELESIKGPEDINIEDYSTPEEYLQALTKATKEQALKEADERFTQRERQKLIEAQQKSVHDGFTKNITEAIGRNPEIKEAVAFLDQYAGQINPHIIHEMMLDENAGELIYDITTNQELLAEMFQGNPVDFIRKMHKMSARIDREARYAPKEEGASAPVPQAMERKAQIAAGLPTQLRGSAKPTKDPSKMGMGEYREWVAAGRPR